jgi:NTE family protein
MTPPRLRPVRDVPARRRGLVLGAGGVLGASWTIGALRALEQTTGWDPRDAEVIIGTSAGSVLAAFLSSGISSEMLENHQRGIVVPGDPQIEYEYDGAPLPPRPRLRVGSKELLRHTARHPRQVRPMAAFTALLPQGRGTVASVGALIDAVVPHGEWAPHPRTWIVAMDYESGRRVPFGRKGAPHAGLSDAVMASCAIPAWYAPVDIGGRRYVDGGACSVASLDLVAHLELDEVFVLSPMTSWTYDKPRSTVGRLERVYRRHVTRQLGREAEKVRRNGTDVVLLGPSAEDLEGIGANLMDPRRRQQVLDTSLRTSAEALRREHPGLADTG